jgi:putative membrane protein
VVPRALAVPGSLAGAGVLAEIGYPLVHGHARAAVTVSAVLLLCAASVGHAAVTRGRRVAGWLLGVFAGGCGAVEAVGLATGWPFGRYAYGGMLGPAVAGVPLTVPLAWAMAGWPAYLVAGRLTSHRATRVLVGGWALASWDLFLDPQMVREGYWTWQQPVPALPGVPGVPLSNGAGWLLVAVLAMLALDLLVSGRAGSRSGADAIPVMLYLWTYTSSVLAHAVFFGLPGSALWGGVGMGLVVLPLLGTLRRQAVHTAPPR